VGDDGRIVVGHSVGLLLDGGGGGGGGFDLLLLPLVLIGLAARLVPGDKCWMRVSRPPNSNYPTSIDVVVVVAFKCSPVLHPDPEGRQPQLGC
jgi:hypothetical protein